MYQIYFSLLILLTIFTFNQETFILSTTMCQVIVSWKVNTFSEFKSVTLTESKTSKQLRYVVINTLVKLFIVSYGNTGQRHLSRTKDREMGAREDSLGKLRLTNDLYIEEKLNKINCVSGKLHSRRGTNSCKTRTCWVWEIQDYKAEAKDWCMEDQESTSKWWETTEKFQT